MSRLRGKSVWYISPTQAIPFIAAISNGFSAAATAAGLKPHVFDGKGSVTAYNQGIDEAVGQKAAGIMLQGVDPKVVSGPLAKARKAGIAIIDSFTTGQTDKLAPGIRAHISGDFKRDGRLTADYVLADTRCKADVLMLEHAVFQVHQEFVASFKEESKRLCPSCKIATQDIDPSKIATTAGPTTQTALVRDPNTNYVIGVDDGLATYIVPAVQQAGKAGSVKVIGHDGVAANLDLIRKGQVQVADFAFPPSEWIGWAQIDQLGRVMLKKPTVKADYVPTQLVDKKNIAARSKSQFPQYAKYKAAYRKLWR